MWSPVITLVILSYLTIHTTAVVTSGFSKTENKYSINNKEKSELTSLEAASDSDTSDKTNRREILADTYGSATNSDYLSTGLGHSNSPLPVYGVPPLALPLQTYGAPSAIASTANYASPPRIYGAPLLTYGVPGLTPPPKYFIPRDNKYKFSKPHYDLPIKSAYYPKKYFPKPFYGEPFPFKDKYIPTKSHGNFLSNGYSQTSIAPQYGAPADTALLNINIGSSGIRNTIDSTDFNIHTSVHYGPPEPSPNPRPPHPGAPAPPTPPEIKYDGWQPIAGLVLNRPTHSYGVLQSEGLNYDNGLSPPPIIQTGAGVAQHGVEDVQILSSNNDIAGITGGGGGSSAVSSNYNIGYATNNYGYQGLSDSYGAPLNTVTGSGGVVSSSGEEIHGGSTNNNAYFEENKNNHQDSSASLLLGLTGGNPGTSLQATKSIEYEIFPNNNGVNAINSQQPQLFNSHDVSYPTHGEQALYLKGSHHHSHNAHGYQGFYNSNRGYKGLSISSSGIGLIPPSGVYGAPSGHYGTPLYSKLNLNTQHSAGIRNNIYNTGATLDTKYLPSLDTVRPPDSFNLYSLPYEHPPVPFRNVAVDQQTLFGGNNLNIEGAQSQALTSYNAPLGTIDGSYSLVSSGHNNKLTVGINNNHPAVNIDLTGGILEGSSYQTGYNIPPLSTAIPHDCSLHSSQSLPSIPLGGLSQNIYTTPVRPHVTYGVPDLSAAQSQTIETRDTSNAIEQSEKQDNYGKKYGKSIAESFGPQSELIKSQSIDLNNIPLQQNQGAYTLQIQSSTGETGSQIPHDAVFSEGLLQSILAAIEPAKQTPEAASAPQSNYSLLPETFAQRNDTLDARNSNQSTDVDTESENKDDKSGTTAELLKNDEIALYFSNDKDRYKKSLSGETDVSPLPETKEVLISTR